LTGFFKKFAIYNDKLLKNMCFYLPINHNITPKQKDSIASELARLALSIQNKNQSAHETVEQFFLINDSTTICSELPIFINPKEMPSLDIEFSTYRTY